MEVTMSGWKCGVWLMALSCWMPAAFADQGVSGAASAVASEVAATAASGVAISGADKKSLSSAQMLQNKEATPEEDYEGGIIAYNRTELIEAQGLFHRAASRGYTKAFARLAEVLYKAGFNNDAAKWYRKGAELGDAEAQFGLAAMYLDWASYARRPGIPMKLDYVEARKWLEMAADQQHHGAISLIADAYVRGGLELDASTRSDAEVLKWINRSVDVAKIPG